MKTLRWAIASSLIGILCTGTAMAQGTMSPSLQQPSSVQQMTFQSNDSPGCASTAPAALIPGSKVQQPTSIQQMTFQSDGSPGCVDHEYMVPANPAAVQQPSSIRQMAFQSDSFPRYVDHEYMMPADPAAGGSPAGPSSPSNLFLAPPAKAETKPAAEAPQAEETPAGEGPCKLFHGPWLDCKHLDLRGYFDVGFTGNPASPMSGFNGPDGYGDLANQFGLDQLYMIAERAAKVEDDCGVNYGYRADVMYGSDAHFVATTPGTEWDSGWNGGSPYYGLAMPQLYGNVVLNKLTLQVGHFYAPCGYENAMPTENFFYSHTYGFLYGMPTT